MFAGFNISSSYLHCYLMIAGARKLCCDMTRAGAAFIQASWLPPKACAVAFTPPKMPVLQLFADKRQRSWRTLGCFCAPGLLALLDLGRGAYLCGQVHGKLCERFAFFQAVEEALGDPR